jgi:pilus assembly protein CpaE
MSVITPNETTRDWKASKREAAVHLYLSGAEGDVAELATRRVAGLPVSLSVLPTTDWINPEQIAGAAAAVIQVDADSPASIKRFQKLSSALDTPLIAASYEPPLALVRTLIRLGAHDVLPLPLTVEDIETSLAPLLAETNQRSLATSLSNGKLVSMVKGVGGAGSTALLTQLAIRFALNEAAHERETCLIDFDMQFGDAAFQLGVRAKLSLADLLDAGTRLDGDLLRATTTEHASGLKIIAAPPEMMPLEGIPSEHVLQIADGATREFGTVFAELPTNWTNWSLSLVARSDLVILVTDLTVTGLNRARRQQNLLH